MKRYGFTVVELIITAALLILSIILILALAGAGCAGCAGLTSANTEAVNSKVLATTYFQQFHPDATKIAAVCATSDTDGNGYVRCTVKGAVPDINDSSRFEWTTMDLECPGGLSLNLWGLVTAHECGPLKHGTATRW
jgi:hypothetical protein